MRRDTIPMRTHSDSRNSLGRRESLEKPGRASGPGQSIRAGAWDENFGGFAMRGASSRGVWKQLDALFRFGTVGDLSDEELLGQFVAGRDKAAGAAFAALVERYGP